MIVRVRRPGIRYRCSCSCSCTFTPNESHSPRRSTVLLGRPALSPPSLSSLASLPSLYALLANLLTAIATAWTSSWLTLTCTLLTPAASAAFLASPCNCITRVSILIQSSEISSPPVLTSPFLLRSPHSPHLTSRRTRGSRGSKKKNQLTVTTGAPSSPFKTSISAMAAPAPLPLTPRLLNTASLALHLPAKLAWGSGARRQ